MFIPDPDPGFQIPDPGVNKAPDPGSATLLKYAQKGRILVELGLNGCHGIIG
jgi:hypothetical protein